MIVSMVRYDLEHEVVGKRIDGKWVDMKTRPSMETICRNLVHWRVMLNPRSGFGVDRIYTDENDLTRCISAVLDRY